MCVCGGFLQIQSHIQNLKFLTLRQFRLPNSASLPTVRSGFTMVRIPVFAHNEGNRIRFLETIVPKNVDLLHHDASFYPLLVSFHLQIAYRKVRNFRIGVNKLVGKVSKSLHQSKSVVV